MTTCLPSFADRALLRERPLDRPVMFHTWSRLLFLHWRMDPEVIQALLPDGLTVDTFDGSAWVAIVPFEMRNIHPTWSPIIPHVSNFLELNLRTYAVDEQGTPGVWFISLCANRWLAVIWGRTCFRLPYHRCSMTSSINAQGVIDFTCRHPADPPRRICQYRFQPQGTPTTAKPDSLEWFLVERYVLFADLVRRGIATGRVFHAPYEIQPAVLEHYDDQPFSLAGLDRPCRPPDHVLYSPGVEVEVFGLKSLRFVSRSTSG